MCLKKTYPYQNFPEQLNRVLPKNFANHPTAKIPLHVVVKIPVGINIEQFACEQTDGSAIGDPATHSLLKNMSTYRCSTVFLVILFFKLR